MLCVFYSKKFVFEIFFCFNPKIYFLFFAIKLVYSKTVFQHVYLLLFFKKELHFFYFVFQKLLELLKKFGFL